MSYIKLNRILLEDAGPCPNVRAVLDMLGQGTYFTVLDIKSGFHNVVVKKSSRKYLGFVTAHGVYTMKRLPMGIMTGPAHFQRCMLRILRDAEGHIVAVYIDDLIIWGSTWQECWSRTLYVLDLITSRGLAVNIGKAELSVLRPKVLGQLLQGQLHLMMPHPKAVAPLVHVQPPSTLQGVQRIFGLLNYFRCYVPDFEEMTAPVRALLAGGT